MNKQYFVIATGLALFTFTTRSEASLISNHAASSQIELSNRVVSGRGLALEHIEVERGPAALTAGGTPSLETPFLIASVDDNSTQNCEMLFDAEGEPSHGVPLKQEPGCIIAHDREPPTGTIDPRTAPSLPLRLEGKTPATESAKDKQAVETPAESEGSGQEPAADASAVAAESGADSQETTEEEETEVADSTGDDTDAEGAAVDETAVGAEGGGDEAGAEAGQEHPNE